MYQVIIVLDEVRNRNYYDGYVISDDSTLGNIQCTDLPPYQDINKAKSCYWSDEALWIFDEEKYEEILADIQAKKEAAEAEAERVALIPTNEELRDMALSNMAAINEINMYIEGVVEPLTDMAALLVKEDD